MSQWETPEIEVSEKVKKKNDNGKGMMCGWLCMNMLYSLTILLYLPGSVAEVVSTSE
jgi:hypothetical protein